MERVGGIIEVKANGELYSVKGSWTYNLGKPKREMVIGSDSVHGYKEMPQEPYIEGAITDNSQLDLETLLTIKDATVTLTSTVFLPVVDGFIALLNLSTI